jgi:hypothetical protein
MQNAAEISPTNFRVTSVFGRKRQGDETIGDETTMKPRVSSHRESWQGGLG